MQHLRRMILSSHYCINMVSNIGNTSNRSLISFQQLSSCSSSGSLIQKRTSPHFIGSKQIHIYSLQSQNTNSTTSNRRFLSSNESNKEEEEAKSKENKPHIDVSKFTHEIHIEMPAIVEGKSKSKILKWYKMPGDIVHPNDTICDIETELFSFGMDVEDECLGIMKEILVKEGEDVEGTGVHICTILHEEEAEKEKKKDEE